MVCCLTIVRTTSHKKLLQSANRKGIKQILHRTFTTRNVDSEKRILDIHGEFSPSYPQNTVLRTYQVHGTAIFDGSLLQYGFITLSQVL